MIGFIIRFCLILAGAILTMIGGGMVSVGDAQGAWFIGLGVFLASAASAASEVISDRVNRS